jgi:hypothetical protein
MVSKLVIYLSSSETIYRHKLNYNGIINETITRHHYGVKISIFFVLY